MTGFVVALLLCSTGLVLSMPSRVLPSALKPGGTGRRGPTPGDGRTATTAPFARVISRLHSRNRPVELHELPLFIHQLAGLLRAGRPPQGLWVDMRRVHAGGTSAFSAAASPVIDAACRAASLGLSVPVALRQGADRSAGGSSTDRIEFDRMWADLAGCLEVAQRSGAPLASILDHYAAQLDAHLDGVAARETALAGPRATVVLLSWLPALGVGLGFGLGIDPIELLTTSPLGLLALAAGILLMVSARLWSAGLIRRAAGATR